MHLLTLSPGLASVSAYIAAPASLSPIATVPASIWLPALVVVALKAPNTPIAARLPRAPTARTVSRTLVRMFTALSLRMTFEIAAVVAARRRSVRTTGAVREPRLKPA